MNTTETIKNLFNEQNLIFFERKTEIGSFFILPYSSKKQNFFIDIFLDTNFESNLCEIGFVCKLNSSKDSSERLLDLNSQLSEGKLSVVSNSNEVTFSSYFEINENFKFDYYKDKLYYCFFVFVKLYNEEIIDKKLYTIKKEDEIIDKKLYTIKKEDDKFESIQS